MSTPYVKLKQPLNEYALLCRGCLAESGEMKNMQEWGLAEDFYRIAEIQKRNNVTELLCTSCEDSLLRCRAFKQRCQDSDSFLKDTAKKKSEGLTDNSITSTLNANKLTITITAGDMDSKILLPCPYAAGNCPEKYLKKHYLYNHLMKQHGLSEKLVIECRYFCSHDECSYFINAGKNKFFTERKYLNQHYNKVHRSKIICEQCHMSLTHTEYERHLKVCNVSYLCQICNIEYKNNERLLVHLMRKHPDIHEQYKRKKSIETSERKRIKIDDKLEYICDSPKKTSATQTRPEENIKNDVTLPPWKCEEAKTDEISTQTVFEDLLSLKSQNEDDSIFFSETVSLSDIQTQTFPLEFGLSRSNKQTATETHPDLRIKETQTCLCLYDSPKPFKFDSVSSSPLSINLTSTETQTIEFKFDVKDELLSFHSTETQTCFDEELSAERL